MSFFGGVKRSFARAKVLQAATEAAKDGPRMAAFEPIFAYIPTDELLANVVAYHNATRTELWMAYSTMRTITSDELHRGNLIAAEAMLGADTLSYLIRAERKTVDVLGAHALVYNFIKTNGLTLKEERAMRQADGH